MKNNQIWSEEFGCYVSRAFMPKKENNIKIDITNCIIKITEFGYYELWLNGIKLKYIGFMDYLKYKSYVKEIIKEADVYALL